MTVRHVMKIERGCGTRVKGGSYLEGKGVSIPCPMLPHPIPNCPTCDNPMISFFRGIKKINPKRVIPEIIRASGKEKFLVCLWMEQCDKAACDPRQERGWVMWVGSEYTPESFALEAQGFGVSKRVHNFPKDLKRGDVIYLGYKTLFKRVVDGKDLYDPGLFYIFHVTDKVRIVDDEEAKDEARMKELEDQGITPVVEDEQ